MIKEFNDLQAKIFPYKLIFKKPAGTSRGILLDKKVWFLVISEKSDPAKKGIGECAPLKDLSLDDRPDIEQKLRELCDNIQDHDEWLKKRLHDFPAIKFALETAILDLSNGGTKILFPSKFTDGSDAIQINGLIWMGNKQEMLKQVDQKLQQGFQCIKMKIGAIDFQQELELLKQLRENFSDEIEIRVDANGAFSAEDALEKISTLAEFKIHSIEQPIKQGQCHEMKRICKKTKIPVALDEELIGVFSSEEKQQLLGEILPQYIILKPTLLGGFHQSQEWIDAAEKLNIGWWITSALESQIGLNAIAQWTYTLGKKMPHGLGTGQLFKNNFESPLHLQGEHLYFDPARKWNLPDELT